MTDQAAQPPKRRSRLSPKLIALILAGASASTIMGGFLDEKEGNRLRAYQDGVRIWTICRGVTRIDGRPVYPGQMATPEQCANINATELGKSLDELELIVKVPLSEPARAGIASFCTYNLGVSKCRASTFIKLLNEGRRAEACEQMKRWIFDGGKDCRVRSNGCFGQVERRDQEAELCMMEDSPA